MTSTTNPKINVQQRKTCTNERIRPRMLKDFLNGNSDSCSSRGFKSFPGRPCTSNAQCSIKIDHLNPNNKRKLLRRRSKAASATISAFQTLINAVKKYPSIFPRSLSRRLSRKNSRKEGTNEVKITVRVKDIVRWSSFKDLVEEKSRALEFASSPQHCTTTTSTNSTTCSSNGSSWCESDFTSEFLPSWYGNSREYGANEVQSGKKYLPCVGRDCMEATAGTESYAAVAVEPKVESPFEENEQQSPVSVLDFQVGEKEEPFSAFTRSLANVERTRQNLMQKIQRSESLAKLESFDLEDWMSMEENTGFEEEEEEEDEEEDEAEEEEPNELEKKARELLNRVEAISLEDIGKAKVEQLLLDFFSEQLTTKKCQTKKDDDDLDSEMVSMAQAWMRGEHNGLYEWGIEHKREAYVSDMDRRERWSKFEEEQQELALEIETQVLGFLVDEVLVDLFLH